MVFRYKPAAHCNSEQEQYACNHVHPGVSMMKWQPCLVQHLPLQVVYITYAHAAPSAQQPGCRHQDWICAHDPSPVKHCLPRPHLTTCLAPVFVPLQTTLRMEDQCFGKSLAEDGTVVFPILATFIHLV